jgi:hypothetical protein
MSDEPMTDKPDGKRTLFVIEDELHSEQHGEFPSFIQAIDELRRRAAIPWNQEPNRAPCTSWKTCGRRYEVIEYDNAEEVRRVSVLEVFASGVKWSDGIGVIDFSNTTRPSTRLFRQLSPFLGKRDFLGKALFDATTALPQKSVK